MPKHHHRRRIVVLILCLLILHSIEIWIFGASYFGLQFLPGFGEFVGFDGLGEFVSIDHLGILDCVYYSAAVFTTLGFGDIVTVGPARFMTGVEAGLGPDVYYLVSFLHLPGNAEDLEPRRRLTSMPALDLSLLKPLPHIVLAS